MASLEGLSQDEVTALAALAQSISSNPKTRIGFQALVKAAHPETATPELDQAQATFELKKQLAEEKAAREAMQAEMTARDTEARTWGEVVGKGLCTWEQVPDVKAFMAENNIASPMSGATFWKQSQAAQLATPQAVPDRHFTMPQDHLDMWRKGGRANLDRAAKDLGYQALNEFRNGKVV